MKNVWRFGSRWDETGRKGTSIFNDVFLKFNVAFAYTHDCLKMREGDLIAFSDGFDVIAIGKAISPPAILDKFDINFDSEHEIDFTDNNITGCRVEIICLVEDDCFRYKKIGKFSAAYQIQEKINMLWDKYTAPREDVDDPQLNLFNWADKELSQDALLCWLIKWASEGNSISNPSLHQIGKKFLETLISQFIPSFSLPRESIVKVFKQRNRIDIAVKIETPLENYALLIEDKVHAEIYNDLDRYLESLKKDEEFQNCDQFFPILIKTGDQASYVGALSAKYKTFLRKDFLEFFEPFKEKCRENAILGDFLSHLVSMEEDVQSFRTKNIGTWIKEWNPWKGFYSFLSENTPFTTWHYVANANGGFLCSSMAGDSQKEIEGFGFLFWQIENDKKLLCLKLYGVEADKSATRDRAIDLIDKFIAENNIKNIEPPARKGCGCCMTLKVVRQNNWLGEDSEVVNLDQVRNRLRSLAQFVEEFAVYAASQQMESDMN